MLGVGGFAVIVTDCEVEVEDGDFERGKGPASSTGGHLYKDGNRDLVHTSEGMCCSEGTYTLHALWLELIDYLHLQWLSGANEGADGTSPPNE